MKTIYIAGPMRGRPGYNSPAFNAAALAIIERGDTPISPVAEDVKAGIPLAVFDPTRRGVDWHAVPEGFDFIACRARCIAGLERADEVVVLAGWEQSAGARAEVAYALWAGKPVRTLAGREIVFKSAKVGERGKV